ncbi:MAG: hypothetical protein HRF40_09990, partial [Nitrososphaera sp.]
MADFNVAERKFETEVEVWLKETLKDEIQLGLISIGIKKNIVADSENYHEVDFILDIRCIPKSKESLFNEKKKEICARKKRLEANTSTGTRQSQDEMKSLESFLENPTFQLLKLVNEMSEWKTAALIEVKGPGQSGIRPTVQTYREHMLRAYSSLGDYRKQNDKLKFLVVPYKIPTSATNFEYAKYFRSVDVHYVDYGNETEVL